MDGPNEAIELVSEDNKMMYTRRRVFRGTNAPDLPCVNIYNRIELRRTAWGNLG